MSKSLNKKLFRGKVIGARERLDNNCKQLYNNYMTIYYYHKSQFHSTKDTDRLIERSLIAYGVTEPVSVLRTKTGKPYVTAEGLFIGVSHTASLVLVAVASCDFGMDAERCDRHLHHLEKLLSKCCLAEEKEQILQLDVAERTEKFLALWTRKEALLKYCGTGLAGLKDADTNGVSGCFYTVHRGKYVITIYAEEQIQTINEENMDGVCFK